MPVMPVMAVQGERVLVVDDDEDVRRLVVAYLERDRYRVREAADVAGARTWLTRWPPDLVVLDVMLPGGSGLDLVRELDGAVPLILLTARAEEADRVLGLELGADDYVTKPFSPRELVARVRSVLRRAATPAGSAPLRFEGLVVDPAARTALVDDRPVALTPREFDLLAFLASHPRVAFSRNRLLEDVWGSSAAWQDPATVTVHVRRLRGKIEPDPDEPRWITTVWGIGYRFEP